MNEEIVLRDLSPFADPGTDISASSSGTVVDLTMVRDGEDIRIEVDRVSGRTTLRKGKGERFPSLAVLLASPLFSDVRRLAPTQRQLYAKLDNGNIIEPEGVITDAAGSRRLTIDGMDAILRQAKGDKIRVVLLDGQAGVGKTSLIRNLLLRRAREVTSPPIIHVESLGSRLFGLNHLLAASLDTLRAKFTYDQAPALIRNGLIQVAIDGFDELVDSEGYADAWGALSDFFSEIGNSGVVILSGRDTFFDQQAFNERLADKRQNIELVSARLSPISPGNARNYLKANGWVDDELSSRVGQSVLKERSYVLRPFFLRTLAEEQNKSWDVLAENTTIRNLLVDRFLVREANLIRSKTSMSLEVSKPLLASVFIEIAMELAASEADIIDTTFIELVVDAVFSSALQNQELGRLTYKAGSIALLEQAEGRRGYRRFPHTEISNYFLSCGLIKSKWSPPMRRVLTRANLLGDFFSVFSEEFATAPHEDAASFVETVDRAIAQEGSSSEHLNSNLAALWVATLSGDVTGPLRQLEGAVINDAAIVGVATAAELRHVVVNRMDARGADLSSVLFNDVTISTLIVDEETRFGSSVPLIAHIQATENASVKNLRGNAIFEWVASHQSGDELGPQAVAEALLWRVASILTRRYVIRDSHADTAGRFLRDPKWPEIERILEEVGRIERVPNRGGGPQDDFVRIFDPIGLMRREDKSSRAIWEKVRQLG